MLVSSVILVVNAVATDLEFVELPVFQVSVTVWVIHLRPECICAMLTALPAEMGFIVK
jgi:hypothetical protein